ncbi:hypothetical protein Ccrd_020050, partial [Cynara cardunculus var. scolymus]
MKYDWDVKLVWHRCFSAGSQGCLAEHTTQLGRWLRPMWWQLGWHHLHQRSSDFDKISLVSACVFFIQLLRTLASMQLTGGLPGDIGELTELQILLPVCSIVPEIFTHVCLCRDLSYNKGLTGSLTPEIGKLRKLTNLIVVGCSFIGPIPDTIGNLERLTIL